MSTVEVIEQPVTVTVEAGPIVQVTETPVTVVVSVDGSVTVTEQPTTVLVQGGDSVTVQESPVTVEIDAVGHPREHDIGGSDHTGVITAAQHGTLGSGNLHPEYLLDLDHVLSLSPHHPRVFDCTVGPAGEADYTTVQAAIDAGEGAIFIQPGTYAGYNVDDAGVKEIIGASRKSVNIDGDVTIGIANVILSEQNFQGSTADALVKVDATGVIFDCIAVGGHATYFTTVETRSNRPKFIDPEFNGNPYPAWLKVWDFDAGGGTYTDNTTVANDVAPTTDFQLVGAGAGDIAYFGSTLRFRGLQCYLTQEKGTAGTIVWEFWNGVTGLWESIPLIVSLPSTDQKNFRRRGLINWDVSGAMVNWATTAINGVTAYWTRARVSVALTQAVRVFTIPKCADGGISTFNTDTGVSSGNNPVEILGGRFKDYKGGAIACDMDITAVGGLLVGTRFENMGISEGLWLGGRSVAIGVIFKGYGQRAMRVGASSVVVGTFDSDLQNGMRGSLSYGGTVSSATANTLTAAGSVLWADLYMRFLEVLIVSGTGAGQRRAITGVAGNVLTVRDNWTTNPDATSSFVITDPFAVGIDAERAGTQLIVAMENPHIGVRGGTQHGITVSGSMNGALIAVQPSDASPNRSFQIGPLRHEGAGTGGGSTARSVTVDMAGGFAATTAYTTTPNASAATGIIYACSVTATTQVPMVGRKATTRAFGNAGVSGSSFTFGSSGAMLVPEADLEQVLGSATKRFADIFSRRYAAQEYIEFDEMVDPAAPAADKGRLYMRDNGAGKTEIVAVFPSGAAQVIATEP